MRKLLGLLAAGALASLAGGAATAAPVDTSATVTVNIGVAQFTLSSTGTVSLVGTAAEGERHFATAGGATGTQLMVPMSLVTVPAVTTVPVPDSTLADNVVLQDNLRNGTGTFSVGGTPSAGEICPSPVPTGTACVNGGGAGGIMPISGTLSANLLGGAAGLTVAIDSLQVGEGGTVTGLTLGNALGGPITATAEAGEWTTGVAQVATSNLDNLTAQTGSAGAPVSFVTPTYLDATISALGSGLELPAFATLTLGSVQVVPEPGMLLQLGAGAAGLAFLTWRRRR